MKTEVSNIDQNIRMVPGSEMKNVSAGDPLVISPGAKYVLVQFHSATKFKVDGDNDFSSSFFSVPAGTFVSFQREEASLLEFETGIASYISQTFGE